MGRVLVDDPDMPPVEVPVPQLPHDPIGLPTTLPVAVHSPFSQTALDAGIARVLAGLPDATKAVELDLGVEREGGHLEAYTVLAAKWGVGWKALTEARVNLDDHHDWEAGIKIRKEWR